MKAITHLAAAALFFLGATPGCATMTLEDAIAEKGLYGACMYLRGSSLKEHNAIDAKVRTMFERQFPVELKIERVVTRDANGKAKNPMKWGELITVHWRIKSPTPLPPGVTAYDFARPRVWFSAMEPTPAYPNIYIAPDLSANSAARMLTGKTGAFSGGKKSFWDFMKGVFVDVPTLAISGGLVGGLGGNTKVSLYDAVLNLQDVIGKQCSYDPSDGRVWDEGECWSFHALVPRQSGENPSHLYFKAPHGILDQNGHGCGLSSQGRLRLPPGSSVAERAEALFQGQWRPLTDFERTWKYEDRQR